MGHEGGIGKRRASLAGKRHTSFVDRGGERRAGEQPSRHRPPEELMLTHACRDCRAEEPDSHADAASNRGRCAALRRRCGVFLTEVDNGLDQERAHELRGVADNLERPSRPELPTEDIVERPGKASLPPTIDLAPVFFERGTTIAIVSLAPESLNGPLGALENAWPYLAIFETDVPFLGSLYPSRPCFVELRSEVARLTGVVHFPQVGRLQGTLVAKRLERQDTG